MKKIKILTIILAIVLVTAISFFGVYKRNRWRMENKIKDYSFGMDIEGNRYVRFALNNENKTIIKDKDGKKVKDSDNLTDEEIAEKGYTKEEVPYNSEEDKNAENYKKTKKIIEERLKKQEVEQYNIRLNEENGEIILELPEKDETTDQLISNVGTTGKFEIIDTDTQEVLMTNNDIEQVKVLYGSDNSSVASNSGTRVYLDIEFNEEGSKKLEEISNTYVKEETTEDDQTEENKTEDGSEEENNEENKTEEDKKEKTITMNIDDKEIMSTSFEEPIKNGRLQLSVGAIAKDEETLQENITRASNMANLLDTSNLPLKYELESNEYVFANINKNQLQGAKYVILAMIIGALVWLTIKYKSTGLLGAFSYIGFISLFLLLIRYTNVVLSNEGVLAIGLIGLLNYIFVNRLLMSENVKELYKKAFISMMPVNIFVIVCCFIRWIPISSFGMVMFWGFVLIAVYNVLVTNNLIKINKA